MNPVSEPETLNTQQSFLKTTERRLNTHENEEEMVFDKVNLVSEMRIGDENEPPTRTTLLPLLKKFIYLMKKNTHFYKFKALTENAFSLLNDPCHFYVKKSTRNKPSNAFQKTQKILIKLVRKFASRNIELFHPYNNVKILWDMIHIIFILLQLFLIPIEVCFGWEIDINFKIFSAIFFICDMLINFNTGYFHKGFIVNERKKIITHYFQTEFLVDIITVIFYMIGLANFEGFSFFEMVFFLRWRKTERIRMKIQEKFKIGLNLHTSLIDLFNLFFFSFYILNIFACFWFYIGNQEEYPTWITIKGIQNEQLLVKYLYSFYWSTVTIMTVGYGDITPTNINEAIYTILTVFFGCGLFAYFINSVGGIVKDITNESRIFRNKLAIINKYMEKKNIDYNLQMKIREYLRFIWQEESTQNVEIEAEIISKLSKSLRSELIFESYGTVLKKSSIFFANFSEKFLGELMYEIKEVRNIPEDLIFTQNQTDDCEIFFIVKGKVEIFHTILEGENSKNNQIQQLKEGESFGETAFFTGGQRNCCAKSTDFTTLFFITREDFLKLLQRNPEDYEKYCMIRDQIIFENRMSFLQTKCFACSSKDHISINCPLIHYLPNKIQLIREYSRDPGQKNRSLYDRSRINKLNSLSILKEVELTTKKFKIHTDSDGFPDADDPDEDQDSQSDLNTEEENNNSKQNLTNKSQIDVFSQNFIKPPDSPQMDIIEEFVKQKGRIDNLGLPVTAIMETEETEETKTDNEKDNDFVKTPIKYNSLEITEQKSASKINKIIRKPSIDILIEKRIPPIHLSRNCVSEARTSPLTKKKSDKKTLKFEEPITNSNGNINILQSQNSFRRRNSGLKIMEEYRGSTEKIDLFDKEFEKGANFKIYYPDHNLTKFLEYQRKNKISKKMKNKHKHEMRSHRTATQTKKSQFVSKSNKIIPEEMVEERTMSPQRVESSNKREKDKRFSNIFIRRSKPSFFTHEQKFSFYDVVYEVLHNSELRKKLHEMRCQTFKRKKTLRENVSFKII